MLIVTTLLLLLAPIAGHGVSAEEPLELGSRRELFVDDYLIHSLVDCQRIMHAPRDEGPVFTFDRPWEGIHSAYCTLLQDGEAFRLYYRGMPKTARDGTDAEVTCVAESQDGIHWTRPALCLYTVADTVENNVVYAQDAPYSHNFTPLLDPRPDCPADERYKALAGLDKTGLVAFTSADGFRWRRLAAEPVIPRAAPFPFDWMFDSQNVAFWSEAEQKFLCYFRVYVGVRRIARVESLDFVHWSEPQLLGFLTNGEPSPAEELYTNQTQPYLRAPQIYLSIAARFVPGRQVLTDAEAAAFQVAPGYHRDLSDAVLMSTRGGDHYDRSFLSSFIRPGLDRRNWVSRTNYPALGLLPTSPTELSLYVNQEYSQPTAHLRRYSIRPDGFASVRAPYAGGELVTKPLTFTGDELRLNFSTSAVGGVRVEIQDAQGAPLPGWALSDCQELIGNELDQAITWSSQRSLRALNGESVRLRIVMKDADLFALRFVPASVPRSEDGSR